MNLAQRLTEARPSVEWHIGRLTSQALYRRAFGSFGPDSIIVRPRILRGVDRIHIGHGVAVYAGAWLQCEAGGGPIEIGDESYLGHDVHLHAIDPLTIGVGCVLADGVLVATTDHLSSDDPTGRGGSRGTGPVIVGNRVLIGQRAVVLGGVTIGDGATIGAGAVVTKDVPAGAVAAGVPARIVEGNGR